MRVACAICRIQLMVQADGRPLRLATQDVMRGTAAQLDGIAEMECRALRRLVRVPPSAAARVEAAAPVSVAG